MAKYFKPGPYEFVKTSTLQSDIKYVVSCIITYPYFVYEVHQSQYSGS